MAAPSDSLSAPFGRNFEGLDGSRVTDPAQSELQLSGIAEGFFVPAFFILLLGAELDFRVLAGDPRAIMLAVVMGAAAIAIHVGAALLAAPTPRAVFGVAASAQLGLPAAAASLGLSTGHLSAALAAAVVAAGSRIAFSRRQARPKPPLRHSLRRSRHDQVRPHRGD
jgi:Kef-type K+ transport system membrane component KefB